METETMILYNTKHLCISTIDIFFFIFLLDMHSNLLRVFEIINAMNEILKTQLDFQMICLENVSCGGRDPLLKSVLFYLILK